MDEMDENNSQMSDLQVEIDRQLEENRLLNLRKRVSTPNSKSDNGKFPIPKKFKFSPSCKTLKSKCMAFQRIKRMYEKNYIFPLFWPNKAPHL